MGDRLVISKMGYIWPRALNPKARCRKWLLEKNDFKCPLFVMTGARKT